MSTSNQDKQKGNYIMTDYKTAKKNVLLAIKKEYPSIEILSAKVEKYESGRKATLVIDYLLERNIQLDDLNTEFDFIIANHYVTDEFYIEEFNKFIDRMELITNVVCLNGMGQEVSFKEVDYKNMKSFDVLTTNFNSKENLTEAWQRYLRSKNLIDSAVLSDR